MAWYNMALWEQSIEEACIRLCITRHKLHGTAENIHATRDVWTSDQMWFDFSLRYSFLLMSNKWPVRKWNYVE